MSARKEKKDAESLFLQEKPVKILILLKKERKPLYVAVISKEINGTYAHTLNVLAELEKFKLVGFKETGRIKLVNLTELGEETARVLENFIDLLKLGKIGAEVDQVYVREVKGRLRGEIDREGISKKFARYKSELEILVEKSPNVVLLAKMRAKKIDGIIAEVMGYPPPG